MIRAIIGVIVGYGVWSGLWILGNSLFFMRAMDVVAKGERYEEPGPLLAIVLQSVIVSLAAGVVCGLIAGRRWAGSALVLGLALLGTGIAVQAGVWDLAPAWYHLSFLALLLPVTMVGARFGRRKAAAPPPG